MNMSSQLHAPSSLTPETQVRMEQEAKWAPEPLWIIRIAAQFLTSEEDRTQIPRLSNSEPSHYTKLYK